MRLNKFKYLIKFYVEIVQQIKCYLVSGGNLTCLVKDIQFIRVQHPRDIFKIAFIINVT